MRTPRIEHDRVSERALRHAHDTTMHHSRDCAGRAVKGRARTHSHTRASPLDSAHARMPFNTNPSERACVCVTASQSEPRTQVADVCRQAVSVASRRAHNSQTRARAHSRRQHTHTHAFYTDQWLCHPRSTRTARGDDATALYARRCHGFAVKKLPRGVITGRTPSPPPGTWV